MITLTTKFHGPTNTRGSRISCRAAGRPWRVYVSNMYGTDVEKHAHALATFVAKHFPPHPESGPAWNAYHYGHTDEGMAFIRMVRGDVVNDCVWINNETGAYSLTDPTARTFGPDGNYDD